MTSELLSYIAALEGDEPSAPLPIEQWNPDFSGDIDIVIKEDGVWFHEGEPIRRAKLAKLFASILRREDEDFFLVTPVEKWRIRVADAPFIVVDMIVEENGRHQSLIFTTNLGDRITASSEHAIWFCNERGAPYISVRTGLEARISRSVYYDLIDRAETHATDHGEFFGVWSAGIFFPFCREEDLLIAEK